MVRTRQLAAAVLLLLVHIAGVDGAPLVDPLLRFHQTRTPHFIVYFHDGEAHLAARLAALVETARLEVGSALRTEPPALTHVILADQTEVANGWATPLPRNTIFLNAAAPSGSEFIGFTDDWLRLVFTHEYTHIVHLDQSRGWARLARGVLGRNGFAFPNMWLPQWQIEGIATFQESAITGEGRLHAGDFRGIERTGAASGHPVTLDRASGGLVGWPDGHAAYAAGLGFHAFLAERYGADSFGRLAADTARSLPYLGSRAFKGVYGQSLGQLWRQYEEQVTRAAASNVNERDASVVQMTFEGHMVSGPRFAPSSCPACTPDTVLYVSRTPHELPSLRRIPGRGASERLASGYLGSTSGVSGTAAVFDRQEIRRNVGLYSELAVYDGVARRVLPIAGTARLQDPDVSPDGRVIAAVREDGGSRALVRVQLRAPLHAPATAAESRASGSAPPVVERLTVLAQHPDQQFSAPRWSPDGRWIAVERRRLGALPEVVVLDAQTGAERAVFADAHARIVTPAWRSDGDAVVAAADFDNAPFDLYEFPFGTAHEAYRLTRTDGAIWPDVSRDGSTLVYAGYTAAGFQIFKRPYVRLAGAPRVVSGAEPSSVQPAASLREVATDPYVPWSTLAPTSWTPYVVNDVDQWRAGGLVGGADVLARHAWSLGASWLVQGPEVVRPLAASTPDWSASYAYTRRQPVAFVSMARGTVFRTASGASGTSRVAGVEHEAQAGVAIPFLHVRYSTQVLGAIAATDTRYQFAGGDRRNRTVAGRMAAAFNSSQRFGYSISRERGIFVGTTVEVASRALGSRANATTATADLRAYLPGLGRHHVVALRSAGGLSNGSDLARQQFSLGALSASGSVMDFGSSALGLMRGGLRASVGGNRLVVGNAEYRVPLKVVERGRGTLPLLLRTVHASVFADVAQVRGDGRTGAGWTRAFGGELSLDGVAGHGLPFVATVGAAWGRDGSRPAVAQVYARIGRAF
ncbi:MAG: BamA/TamA family outer membrane protein [Vicinamibacterales bacterium]